MSAPAEELPSSRDSLEVIGKHATRYDLASLVHALERAGVDRSRIRFDSRSRSRSGGPSDQFAMAGGPSLVAGLKVDEGKQPEVTVQLNVGLFSACSPLPAYFSQLLLDEPLAHNLVQLLTALDQGLLNARASGADPKRRYLSGRAIDDNLAGALVNTSVVYAEWLFRKVFPELHVEVRRDAVPRRMRVDRVALGSSHLGACALDGNVALPRHALDVCLTVSRDEAVVAACATAPAEQERGWITEAKARLERHVLPRFHQRSLSLRVRVRILRSDEQARLDSARVDEAEVAHASSPFVFTIFSGYLGD